MFRHVDRAGSRQEAGAVQTNDFSLYKRMLEQGTLTDRPCDVPDARFTLPSTIHWMRALALLAGDLELDFKSARSCYARVQRRSMTDQEVNSICEQLLFALNQFSALQAMLGIENKADVARIGIVAWYYGVYGAASAMIAATDGSFPETHAGTAQQWDRKLVADGWALPPFADRLSSLSKKMVAGYLASVRSRGIHSLTKMPTTAQQAWGCCAEYLSGTAEWEQRNVNRKIKASSDFKKLNVHDFRTKAAREFRDSWYENKSIAFLHQAFRYRGKANYRDAIYLAYGNSVSIRLSSYIDDLAKVLAAFSAMAAAYVSLRMGQRLWTAFIDDLETKRAVTVSPMSVWS